MKDARSFKREFLLDPAVTFLNHGSFGACPEPVFRVFQNWQRELEREPVEFLLRRAQERMALARTALADYLGCVADDLVLVPNATYGLNMVARSLPLGPGDRVLTTDHEYGAIDRLWEFVCERSGATVVRCQLPLPLRTDSDVVGAFEGLLDESVRVVALSHVSSPTGLVLPVAELCRRAREVGAITVVDGAHGPGQLDLDLSALGCDFYVGNGHKWLCGPKVAGFLHTRPGVELRVDPLVVSWGWDERELVERAHWQGTQDLSAYLTLPAAIEYQQERDWPAVRARCVEDAVHLRQRLAALPGVRPVGEAPMFRQMVSVLLPPGQDAAQIQQTLLAEHAIEIPVNPWHDGVLLRASVAAYNDRDELDRFVDALATLL